MERGNLKQIIDQTGAAGYPEIKLIKQAQMRGPRLGVFASSFNPVTIAHIELVRRAARQFSLDSTLVLASKANADKSDYACSLEDRLRMLVLTFDDDPRVSVGLASHAYFVDLVEALKLIYPPQTELHFILGFDTFERVLDPENRYTPAYHRKFNDRRESLEYLFENSSLIVASRSGADLKDVKALISREPAWFHERVLYLDFPEYLGERSATEVRERLRAGESITGLVPAAAEQYINEQRLYR